MNIHSKVAPTAEFERFLEEVEAEIELPPSRYEAARASYDSVGHWLNREESSLRNHDPQVYVQGSFRLGTAIKPFSEDDEYDVDVVCELRKLLKSSVSQKTLKTMLGKELKAYSEARNMAKPISERTRCWTLHYADSAQFHLDVTPCVPNSAAGRLVLERLGVPQEWTKTAISITDKRHDVYEHISEDWPRSNPKAFCEWFKVRMGAIFVRRRQAIALQKRAAVEQIPVYEVKTPLQSAIKLLKRHRDIVFSGDMDDAPISIIITTLSAQAYDGEETTGKALAAILAKMDENIRYANGVWIIENPTDPHENFADRWNPKPGNQNPKKETAFRDWLAQARKDFVELAGATDRAEIASVMSRAVGSSPVQRILARGSSDGRGIQPYRLRDLPNLANHRRKSSWPVNISGQVRIKKATFMRKGFLPESIASDGRDLEKFGDLRFEAGTDVLGSYKVFWQVVNTGEEAERARGLRGTFEYMDRGGLTRSETTQYRGCHSIECFIVKDGKLAARSGPFVVNIK